MAKKTQKFPLFETSKRIEHLGITVTGKIFSEGPGKFAWYTSHYYRQKDSASIYIPGRITEASLDAAQDRLEGYLSEFEEAESFSSTGYL